MSSRAGVVPRVDELKGRGLGLVLKKVFKAWTSKYKVASTGEREKDGDYQLHKALLPFGLLHFYLRFEGLGITEKPVTSETSKGIDNGEPLDLDCFQARRSLIWAAYIPPSVKLSQVGVDRNHQFTASSPREFFTLTTVKNVDWMVNGFGNRWTKFHLEFWRKIKAVRKTRVSQVTSSDKLARLNVEFQYPLELAKAVLMHEMVKELAQQRHPIQQYFYWSSLIERLSMPLRDTHSSTPMNEDSAAPLSNRNPTQSTYMLEAGPGI
ncbi:hypothetical protein F5887DRAFT_1075753 [Amanita rubescens]|nr:hypothetical protein F5887DRAFT_1075753 [Amanita rubescens]